MKMHQYEFLVHISDLLHLLSLFLIVTGAKYGTPLPAAEVQRHNRQQQQAEKRFVPFAFLLVLCVGAAFQIMGTLYPGAPHLEVLWERFQSLQSRAAEKAGGISAVSVVIHMMTISESAYDIVLSIFVFVMSFSLAFQYLVGKLSRGLTNNDNSNNCTEKSTLGFIVFSVLLSIFAIGGSVVACMDVPKFVRPNSPLEAMALIPKCLPSRYGLFSLMQLLTLLNFPKYLWGKKRGENQVLAISLLVDLLGLIIFLTAWGMRSDFQLENAFFKGSSTWKLHFILAVTNLVVYLLFYVPKMFQNSVFLVAIVATTGVLTSVIVSQTDSGAVSALISGYSSVAVAFFLANALASIHGQLFQ